MSIARSWFWWSISMTLLCACSGDDAGADGNALACAGGDERCGEMCSALRPCPFGLYCGPQATCEKQCDAEHPCAGGGVCQANGMCKGGVIDGGIPNGPLGGSTAGTAGRSAAAGRSGGTAGGRPNSCADTVVTTTRTTPTVILIVDQSSSMDEEFDNGSRWNVLRDFLLDEPGGLIADLQSQVHFGLALYSAESGGTNPTPIGECPMVTTVAPAADNYAAIAAAYRGAEPIEDTPTGDSIDKLVNDLGFTDPDATVNPVVFVLATDGEPDRCEELDPQNGQQEAVDAVKRAFQSRIRTFIISVGSEISEAHQQDMANAGLGRGPSDPPAEYWRAGNDQSLRDALTSIVGGQLGCEVALSGKVQSGNACMGKVMLNGDPLTCDDPNGWELLDENHIRLLGTACDELKMSDDVFLEVSFPCQVGVVF